MSVVDEILKIAAAKVLVVSQVEPEVKEFRAGVCEGCEKRDIESNRCKVCRCYLDVKTGTKENRNAVKMRYEITHCPLGKWGDLETANEYRKIDGLPPLPQT